VEQSQLWGAFVGAVVGALTLLCCGKCRSQSGQKAALW